MTLQAHIKWVTNVDDFKKGVESGTGMVVAHTAKVDKLVQSMGGNGLFGAVNNTVAAIEKLGGIQKLTGAEQERYNALVTKGIEKAEAMGREVPQAWRDIAKATSGAADETAGVFGKMGAGVQKFAGDHKQSLQAVGQAAGLLVGAVGAAAAAIVMLGQRGADVADVQGAFDQLNRSAGGDGPKALAALRVGVGGLLSDYDLMKPMNAALSAGFKMNEQDAHTMARAAWVLADAQGGDLKESYDKIAGAMATGKVASLGALGLNIELKGASAALKQSLDAEGEAVTSNAVKQANRQAAMEAMNRVVLEAGEAELDFGEKLTRVKVQIGNMTDSLGVAIATSPVIATAMDGIGDALQSAFGANQTDTIQTLIGYVNQAAIVLVDVASVGVSSAKYMVFAWQGLKMLFAGLMTVIYTLAAGFNEAFASILEGAAKIPGVGKHIAGAAADMREMAVQTEGMRKSFQAQTSEALDKAGSQGAAFDGVNSKLEAMRGKMVAAASQQVSSAAVADGLAKKHEELATQTGGASKAALDHAKAIQGVTDKLSGTGAIRTAQDYVAALSKGLDVHKLTASAQADVNKVMEAAIEVYAAQGKVAPQAMRDLWFETVKLPPVVAGLGSEFKKLGQHIDVSIPKVEEFGLKFKVIAGIPAGAKIGEQIDMVPPKVRKANDGLAELAKSLTQLAQVGGDAFGPMLQGLSSIVVSLSAAKKQNEEWGGSAGIASALFSDQATKTEKAAAGIASAGVIAQGAMAAWAAGAEAASTKAALFHGALSGAQAGAAFGPWGAAIGAAGGALLGFIAHMNAGRNAVTDFAKSFGGYDDLHAKLGTLGAAGEDLWKKLTQGVGRSNPEQAKAVIAEITAAFEKQKASVEALRAEQNTQLGGLLGQLDTLRGRIPAAFQPYIDKLTAANVLTKENGELLAKLTGEGEIDWKRMEETAKKYGIALEGLGPQFQSAKLHDGAQQLWDDYKLLIDSGADVGAVLDGMSGSIGKLVSDSLKFGVDIPENFRPLIKNLIDSDKLILDNGTHVKDINTLKFGTSIQTSIEGLITKIGELIDKMIGPNGVAAAIGKIPRSVVVDVEQRFRRTDYGAEPDSTSAAMVAGFQNGGIVPQYFANGGMVVDFAPRGTDTVPAMLTPGEKMLHPRAAAALGPARVQRDERLAA